MHETVSLVKYKNGQINKRNTLRKLIAYERGYNCESCGIFEWNEKPITLQVDHVDGDSGNNFPDNVRLLCPNCHTQTDTFCGKNIGFGRGSRGLSLS